jgi:hypothetical protein
LLLLGMFSFDLPDFHDYGAITLSNLCQTQLHGSATQAYVHLAPEDGPDQETEGDRRGGLSGPRRDRWLVTSVASKISVSQSWGTSPPISGIRILR